MSALAGRSIIVTRAPHQAAALEEALTAAGAIPLSYPCIEIAPTSDTAAVASAIEAAAAGDFDWIVFTSSNTVDALTQYRPLLSSSSSRLRCAAVGPSTAGAVKARLGLRVELVPERHHAAALAESLPVVAGDRVLLPQSVIADDALAERLTERGAIVTRLIAYTTLRGSGGVDLPVLLAADEVDAITLTSGSTFMNLLARLEIDGGSPGHLANVPLACIGDETAAAARSRGFQPAVVSADHSLRGLVDALAAYFESQHAQQH